jgi:hypothetical protein
MYEEGLRKPTEVPRTADLCGEIWRAHQRCCENLKSPIIYFLFKSAARS